MSERDVRTMSVEEARAWLATQPDGGDVLSWADDYLRDSAFSGHQNACLYFLTKLRAARRASARPSVPASAVLESGFSVMEVGTDDSAVIGSFMLREAAEEFASGCSTPVRIVPSVLVRADAITVDHEEG